MQCFVHFHLKMRVLVQRRAIFPHRNFKKCSETVSSLRFWLQNVLLATAACNFSTSQLQKVLRDRQFFTILTSKCASRHSGVQFFISPLNRYLRTRRFTEVIFRPSPPTNHWKTQHFATSLTFRACGSSFSSLSRNCIFFLLTLLLFSAFSSSDSATLLCFFNCPYCQKLVRLLNFLRLRGSPYRQTILGKNKSVRNNAEQSENTRTRNYKSQRARVKIKHKEEVLEDSKSQCVKARAPGKEIRRTGEWNRRTGFPWGKERKRTLFSFLLLWLAWPAGVSALYRKTSELSPRAPHEKHFAGRNHDAHWPGQFEFKASERMPSKCALLRMQLWRLRLLADGFLVTGLSVTTGNQFGYLEIHRKLGKIPPSKTPNRHPWHLLKRWSLQIPEETATSHLPVDRDHSIAGLVFFSPWPFRSRSKNNFGSPMSETMWG